MDQKDLFDSSNRPPKYAVGTIVWYKQAPVKAYLLDGTVPFEIDCKILKSYFDNGNCWYELVTGHGERITREEKFLVNKTELMAAKAKKTYFLKEASFGLIKDDIFFLMDDWVINERLGIYFDKTYFLKNLRNYFYVISGTGV